MTIYTDKHDTPIVELLLTAGAVSTQAILLPACPEDFQGNF